MCGEKQMKGDIVPDETEDASRPKSSDHVRTYALDFVLYPKKTKKSL